VGSLLPALLNAEYWVQLKPVLGGVRYVALIHYPSSTDSHKQSLQFSCNFVVINASDGSLCFQNFMLYNRCKVACGSCKKLSRTSLQCCYIFWSFGIIDASTIKCWELSTAQIGARGVRDVALIYYPSCSDSIKPSLQFICNFVVINTSEGSLCFQNFIKTKFPRVGCVALWTK
jgi:hypothetical protein